MLRARNCLLCGDPLPAGSRIDRQYCRDSCRTLAGRVRKGKRRAPAMTGQTVLQHISPSGTTEQRPLSPLLTLALQHEAQTAELQGELAELRQRLTEKTQLADELAAENQRLRLALEEAWQQRQAAPKPSDHPQPNSSMTEEPGQPAHLPDRDRASSPQPPPASRHRLSAAEIQVLVDRALQSVESIYLTQPSESRETVRAFFVTYRRLLSFLSHRVALTTLEEEKLPTGISMLPEHLLARLEQEMTRQAPADQPALFFRQHAELLHLLVDTTVGAVRRASPKMK